MRQVILTMGILFSLNLGCKELSVAQTGNTGGAGGAGGAGGVGGGNACAPQSPCSTGLPGACAMGELSCEPAMSCIQTVQPQPERCDSSDANCDGKGCEGSHLWSRRFGNPSGQNVDRLVADHQGNVIITGDFQGTVDFGGISLTSTDPSNDDIFLVKMDPQGKTIWAKKFGGASWQDAFGIAVDAQDDIIIVGSFDGELTIGNSEIANSDGLGDLFIAKVDSSGKPMWINHPEGPGYQGLYDVVVDNQGNIVAVGEMSGTINFATEMVVSKGDSDAVVFAVAANGSENGHLVWGTPVADGLWAAAVDSTGSVYATGETSGNLDFGGGFVVPGTSGDGFVVKINNNGDTVWGKAITAASEQYGVALACDKDDNLVFVFEYQGTVNAGGMDLGSFPTVGDTGMVKFDSSGKHLWSKRLYNNGAKENAFRVTFDPLGNIIIAGMSAGNIDFGDGTRTAMGEDLFLAKLDPQGKPIWSHGYGNANAMARPYAISRGLMGDVFVGGALKGAIDFGGGNLTSAGDEDAFIVQFSP